MTAQCHRASACHYAKIDRYSIPVGIHPTLRMLPTDLLAKALLAYSVHEHQLGHVRRIDIWIRPDGVVIPDDGRGMGLDREGYIEGLLGTLVGQGADVQLHGVGLSMVAALTPIFEVESNRDGTVWKQRFEFGLAVAPASRAPGGPEIGTRIALNGLGAPSAANVVGLLSQCEVWRKANPGLTLVIHE